MRFLSFAAIVLLALVAPVLATPTATLQARAAEATLTCTPTTNDSAGKQKYTITTERAQTEMIAAGFAPGKSGDPHAYNNGDGIIWGNNNCDKAGAILLEYPVYRQSSKNTSWKKDTPTNQQDPTPMRVVFANANGAAVYCGVMIHATVNSNESGSGPFKKCT